MLHVRVGNIIISNSIFRNIKNNYYENNNSINTDNKLFFVGNEIKLIIQNSTFDNIYLDKGFEAQPDSEIYISNSVIQNNKFWNGFIYYDSIINDIGKYKITNSTFFNNTAYNGPILNIINAFNNKSIYKIIEFNNSIFINNTALNFGGVIYSICEYTEKSIAFNSCHFINNTAKLGSISYSFTKKNEPLFTNINELRNIKGAFATNPTEIRMILGSPDKIFILSGNNINNIIKSKIYDDYGNECIINSDFKTLTYDQLMFFKVEINDTYNTEIIGQTTNFCWENECTFPLLKIVGNPGNYKMKLELKTFGQFNNFKNNFVEINLTIENCNSSYILQNIEHTFLKSCYIPVCDPPCNSGKCVNNNVCNCHDTYYTGLNNPIIKSVNVNINFTNDLKEYKVCSYPVSKRISMMFNLIIILIGSRLSYSIRYTAENYKEKLIENQNGVNPQI
ncbi:hypothetical protein PIROE2DRAFT_2533 [Piromyces sp. E2]|nr:hypothetical protein PIROE2DRAFT_2533 [Piromyces sp. E2]|eukprot:OUM69447.1 hypothetical protein PIROE2DRAFT_2533 [Piromyces sp. E2]